MDTRTNRNQIPACGIRRRQHQTWRRRLRPGVENGEVNADEIELILTATSSSDVIYPSAACIVQKRIGAQNALAFDLNGACSGFVIAFNTAQAYIRAGIYKTILVVGAEA